jgi:hypothetical protein
MTTDLEPGEVRIIIAALTEYLNNEGPTETVDSPDADAELADHLLRRLRGDLIRAGK